MRLDGLCTISSTRTQHPYSVESSATCAKLTNCHFFLIYRNRLLCRFVKLPVPVNGTQKTGCSPSIVPEKGWNLFQLVALQDLGGRELFKLVALPNQGRSDKQFVVHGMLISRLG